MTDYERLYENIKRLSYERDITLGNLCKRAGLYRSMITDLKSGRKRTLSNDTVEKLCDVLECNPEDILDQNASVTDLERPKQKRNEQFYERLADEMEERPAMRRLFRAAHRATDAQVNATAVLLESIIDGTLGSGDSE